MESPKVFASYSHDSDAHKEWVLKLCTKLRQKGVDVTLDEWDLGPGDLMPPFMREGITDSDRVLVICTERYVERADALKGGVGYEMTIADTQLDQDLRTNKFIPIIRQLSSKPKIPTSLGIRRYVNFSDDSEFDEKFNELLRAIHDDPLNPKPSLGEYSSTEWSSKSETSNPHHPDTTEKVEFASQVYQEAIELAREDDTVGWQQLVKRIRQNMSNEFREWKPEFEKQERDSTEKTLETVDKAVDIVSPLISVALAGVESRKRDFNDQKSVLHDLFTIVEWKDSTYTTWIDMPNVLRYVYHSLHGVFSLDTNQLNLALNLVRENVRVTSPESQGRSRLWEIPQLTGRYYFNAGATDLWTHLVDAHEKWEWLTHIFTDDREKYAATLVAYYMALNVYELASIIASGEESKLDTHYFNIPLDFLSEKYERKERAIDILLCNSRLSELWECLGVTQEQMNNSWGIWIDRCKHIFRNQYQGYYKNGGIHRDHENFFDKL